MECYFMVQIDGDYIRTEAFMNNSAGFTAATYRLGILWSRQDYYVSLAVF